MARKIERLALLCSFVTATHAISEAETDSYPPLTFVEAVETSSVIVKGYLVDVFPGRTIRSAAVAASSPGLRTEFLKITPSNVLKGDREDYYLVEVRASVQGIDEWGEGRYGGELLLLLSPAHNWEISPEVTLSPEAQAEWALDKPLYELIRPWMLFAMTGSGRLASPLEESRELADLYTRFNSLGSLEGHIAAIQAGQSSQRSEPAAGFRDWGATGPVERVEPELAEGLTQGFYPDGQRRFEYNVVDGELKEARSWQQNGQLLRETSFENGEQINCRAWTPEGVPTSCQAPPLFQF